MTDLEQMPPLELLATPRNRLLSALPADELALLAPLLEPVTLARRQVMYDPDRAIEHVYFIEHGIASILSVLGDGSAVETGTIGRDGMVGLAVFHGVDGTAEQAMMQVPGDAYRVRSADFRGLLPQLPTLSALLHRFAAFSYTLAAQNSACNRKHSVEQRCARWLLIVHDRVDGDDIGLTHDFISQMLGVRRASVTDTLAALESRGLISTGRNRVTVLDRPALEALVCECYPIMRSAYTRCFEGFAERSVLDSISVSSDGFSTVGDGTPIAASLDEPPPNES